MAKRAGKRRIRRNVARGIAHIKASFNNTLVTITDVSGDVLCKASAGTMGFKGTRKSTPFAAQRAVESVAHAAKKVGLVAVGVRGKRRGVGGAARQFGQVREGLGVEIITAGALLGMADIMGQRSRTE